MGLLKPCQIKLSIRNRSSKAAGVQLAPKSGIVLKNLLVAHYQVECAEAKTGTSGTFKCYLLDVAIASGKGGSSGSLLFEMDTKLSKSKSISKSVVKVQSDRNRFWYEASYQKRAMLPF